MPTRRRILPANPPREKERCREETTTPTPTPRPSSRGEAKPAKKRKRDGGDGAAKAPSKSEKKKEDPLAPEAAGSAYPFHRSALRPELRSADPSATLGGSNGASGDARKESGPEREAERERTARADGARRAEEERVRDARNGAAGRAKIVLGNDRKKCPSSLEIRPLRLQRVSSTSKPVKAEHRSESAKESRRSETVLAGPEGPKSTTSKNKPQAEEADDESSVIDTDDEIWTSGLPREAERSSVGDGEADAENDSKGSTECETDETKDSEVAGAADDEDRDGVPDAENALGDGCDRFEVDVDESGGGVQIGNAEILRQNDGNSKEADEMDPSLECNSNDDDSAGSESLLSASEEEKLMEGRSRAEDKENSSSWRPDPNARRVSSLSSAAARTVHKAPREDVLAKDGESGTVPRQMVCVQARQTLFKLVPVDPKSLHWTSAYAIPDESNFFAPKTIELLTKDRKQQVLLGRSPVTGIKSMLISRSLCAVSTWNAGGEPAASVAVHKSPDQHAVHLDGRKIESSEAVALEHGSVLSLYGPTGYAYRVRMENYVPESSPL